MVRQGSSLKAGPHKLGAGRGTARRVAWAAWIRGAGPQEDGSAITGHPQGILTAGTALAAVALAASGAPSGRAGRSSSGGQLSVRILSRVASAAGAPAISGGVQRMILVHIQRRHQRRSSTRAGRRRDHRPDPREVRLTAIRGTFRAFRAGLVGGHLAIPVGVKGAAMAAAEFAISEASITRLHWRRAPSRAGAPADDPRRSGRRG